MKRAGRARAPRTRPRWGSIDHVVGISSTARGAALAYLGRDGTVRASALERWAGVAPCLLLADDEEREIREGRSPVGAVLRDGLVEAFGTFPPTRAFEVVFPLWLDWLLRDLPVRAGDVDLVVTGDGYFATSPARLGRCLHRWLPGARVVADLDQHAVLRRQAFWPSGFDEAAVVTLDAGAEPLDRLGGRRLAATVARRTRARGWEVLAELCDDPESNAGLAFETFCRHLGLHQCEQNLVGPLAAGGGPALLDRLAADLRLAPDGSVRFLAPPALRAALADWVPPRAAGAPPEPRHRDVAHAAQEILARIVGHLVRSARALSGCDRLAFAGEVAANAAARAAAAGALPPSELFVPGEPGDRGQALGCALYGAHEVARWPGRGRAPEPTGPCYDEDEMLAAAEAGGLCARRPDDADRELCRRLVRGEIVALFAGGAPLSDRPPGARTLLADPRRPAPGARGGTPDAVVLAESVEDWFESPPDGVRGHGTARPRRTLPGLRGPVAVWPVAAGSAPLRGPLEAFFEASGLPLLAAAPLLGRGGAPAETPEDAVDALTAGAADALLLGRYLTTPAGAGGRVPR